MASQRANCSAFLRSWLVKLELVFFFFFVAVFFPLDFDALPVFVANRICSSGRRAGRKHEGRPKFAISDAVQGLAVVIVEIESCALFAAVWRVSANANWHIKITCVDMTRHNFHINSKNCRKSNRLIDTQSREFTLNLFHTFRSSFPQVS